MEKSLLVFGAGYGFSALAQASWLHDCQIYYWGDIDTHGFAILDELRSHFPHARSLLMDIETLLANQTLWGKEGSPLSRNLPRLTANEQALYSNLRDQRFGKSLRLEQEHIAFHLVTDALKALGSA